MRVCQVHVYKGLGAQQCGIGRVGEAPWVWVLEDGGAAGAGARTCLSDKVHHTAACASPRCILLHHCMCCGVCTWVGAPHASPPEHSAKLSGPHPHHSRLPDAPTTRRSCVLTHPQVIDTSELFRHRGCRKLSLRFLASYLLGASIQTGSGSGSGHVGGPGGHGPMGHGGHGHVALGGGPGGLGHDAIEDARTAMRLYHKYLEVGVGCRFRVQLAALPRPGAIEMIHAAGVPRAAWRLVTWDTPCLAQLNTPGQTLVIASLLCEPASPRR